MTESDRDPCPDSIGKFHDFTLTANRQLVFCSVILNLVACGTRM